MKKRGSIIAIFSGIAIGALAGFLLLPDIPFWKLLLLLIIPMIGFFIFYKNAKWDNHFDLLNHLLENIEEGHWEENNREFIILKKTNPSLAGQLLKVQHNYQANKQFTQNAAHELQTPLAIIKGHAELLLQAPSLSENEAEAIGAIFHSINRLSRLNSALILLAKIEQGRFNDEKPVNINETISITLEYFSDMINLQKLIIEKKYPCDFTVNMSATLAEILIANLLQNAIRHNLSDGFIKIETNKEELKISNAGKPLKTSPENLFKRFYRESEKEESLGLGLSIVKRIAQQSGLKVEYTFEEGVHSLRVFYRH